MRFFFVTLFFFFAPVILMFALRHLTFLLRVWLAFRRARKAGGETVIDVTPEQPQPASRKFIVFVVLLGLICAGLVWMRLGETVEPQGAYVPATVDAQGHIVPGHYTRP